jgi:hypothetical protein
MARPVGPPRRKPRFALDQLVASASDFNVRFQRQTWVSIGYRNALEHEVAFRTQKYLSRRGASIVPSPRCGICMASPATWAEAVAAIQAPGRMHENFARLHNERASQMSRGPHSGPSCQLLA